MEINRSNISEIVAKASLRPDKDYGQNFLVEPDISKRIVEALNIELNDKVIEVGPGLGSLTHYIAQTNAEYDAVDIDLRMVNFLKVVYQDCPHVQIIENDIRKQNISKYTKIIGNLPYNITTECIQYFLLNAVSATKMVFMIQSEAINRFYDVKGKDYGPVSVLLHLLGEIKKLFTVKAGSFYPAPKCNSVVFTIDINRTKNRKEAIGAYVLAKKLFTNRRKTIQNNLLNLVKNKECVLKMCDDLSISPLSRPEDLDPETYLRMFKYLENIK